MSCRICFDAGIMYKLPCECKETLGYVHAHCFVQWMVRRYPRRNGHVCEVCGTPYRRLERVVNSEYQQAVCVIMRCIHAFIAYAVCMFSFCCFWALSHNIPIDSDTCNAGLLIIVLLTAGTLVHMYNCIMYKLPVIGSMSESERVLQQYILSCVRVEMIEDV